MTDRIKRLHKLTEDTPYLPGADEYVITGEHTFEEIIFHMLSEISGSFEERREELKAIVDMCDSSDFYKKSQK